MALYDFTPAGDAAAAALDGAAEEGLAARDVWLVGASGAALGRCVGLSVRQHAGADSAITVGRAPTCTLALNDPEVSSQHARFWFERGGSGSTDGAVEAADDGRLELMAADRPGSFNGTYLRLSGEREASAAYMLQVGDAFNIGEHTATLRMREGVGEEGAAGATEPEEGDAAVGAAAAQASASAKPGGAEGGLAEDAGDLDGSDGGTMRLLPLKPNAATCDQEQQPAAAQTLEAPLHTMRSAMGAARADALGAGADARARKRVSTAVLQVVRRGADGHAGAVSELELSTTGPPVTIGRARSNTLALPTDQLVSASHAELEWRPGTGTGTGTGSGTGTGAWCLRDMGSSNGTTIRLSPERTPSRAFPLPPGSRLILGSSPRSSELHVARFRRGVAERKGRRPTMEDAHVACDALQPPRGHEHLWQRCSLYAVYDGHAGADASAFCRLHLHRHLLNHLAQARDGVRHAGADMAGGGPSADGELAEGESESGAQPQAAASSASQRISLDELASALRAAFATTDEQLLASSASAGTTAVVAVVSDTHVLVANCGDSRAYVWRNGRALRMSVDHKPDRADETARIKAAGGFVSNGRVLHMLAVSRALGDRDFKVHGDADEAGMQFSGPLVSAEPELRVCRMLPGDELLLACDGLWEVLTAEEAFEYLHSHGGAASPQQAVQQLVQAADEEFRSTDNITAVYVPLSAPP